MMLAGLHGHSIAYNEHGLAPRASALGMRPGAHAERARNARAAKAERRARKPHVGPAQPPRTPRRERYVLHALRAGIKRAQRAGDMTAFAKLATQFESLMTARSRRLGVA